MNYLTPDFLKEILRLCFLKKSVLETLSEHFKYQYVPVKLQEIKAVFKSVIDYYGATSKLPTYGIISQQHERNDKVLALITEVKNLEIPDTESIMHQLEMYIKDIRFQLLMKQSVELYNEDRQTEAINLVHKESEEINKFSISNVGKFTRLFIDAEKRFEQREMDAMKVESTERIPFYIPPLDKLIYGGMEEGEIAIFMMRSGGGKSTFLRWVAVHAAMSGFPALFISGEDTQKINEQKLDQVWTKSNFFDIKTSNFTKSKRDKIEKLIKQMRDRKRELHIYAYEEFDSASMRDVRSLIIEFQKIYGIFPMLIIIDYLELFEPGDGYKYGIDTQSVKMKLTNSARRLKNICKEFPGLRGITATQSGDVHVSNWNDPSYVLTRGETKGDKNLADSFSYFITGNQTKDERENGIMRLFMDKFRNYKSDQVIKHLTEYEKGRFYKPGDVVSENIGVENFKKARKKLKKDK